MKRATERDGSATPVDADSPDAHDDAGLRAIRRPLLAWYRRERRDLPWRRTSDPYAIWISETMLQQTRVETVIPYYERFLSALPDVRALADADADDLMGLWAGLGYYRRARNLQAAARRIVAEHDGRLPGDLDELLRLEGVGRYTAGAVASIAFDREAPILDGNVTRVLARLLFLQDDVGERATVDRLWSASGTLVRGAHPGDLNQALMELGARVCVPRTPHCDRCPIARHCRAYEVGDPASLPKKAARPRVRRARAACALLARDGRFLAVRREPKGLLGGLWELPGGELALREAADRGLCARLLEATAMKASHLEHAGRVRHVFTHRRLELEVFRAHAGDGRVTRPRGGTFDAHRWVSRRALEALPMSELMRKALDVALPS